VLTEGVAVGGRSVLAEGVAVGGRSVLAEGVAVRGRSVLAGDGVGLAAVTPVDGLRVGGAGGRLGLAVDEMESKSDGDAVGVGVSVGSAVGVTAAVDVMVEVGSALAVAVAVGVTVEVGGAPDGQVGVGASASGEEDEPAVDVVRVMPPEVADPGSCQASNSPSEACTAATVSRGADGVVRTWVEEVSGVAPGGRHATSSGALLGPDCRNGIATPTTADTRSAKKLRITF
jgi:hypothetical protein